ncbi:DUF2378 family protein [Aggregicoccus sp. 17bor-14]|uniref:DUF2378 family protein n=1 Tax=Myxococcaceae TaxID=31 RepID=UPI00129D1A71|nr:MULTISPECIES: DUF2378 family protein [Myxococcaceae]MBF5043411.1 DUF2378 family protein [Simulacricoccus sp. 17bor-14]MRI89169.1 DUF2378 family protein [Aggregicoccus sp. 17bor-14]
MPMRRPEPSERLVYASVVEGLLRHGVQEPLPLVLKERLRHIGVDVDRPLLPAYPVPMWMHCLRAVAEELYPGEPLERALRALAVRHAEGYGHTVVGHALYAVARMMGPRRMVHRLPHLLASGDNYTRAELLELAPAHYELRMNSEVDMPGYAEGLMEALLGLSGAREPQVQELERGDGHTRFSLRWAG